MDCHHEHKDHGSHDHKHDEKDRGAEYSLYKHINTSNVVCFNEREEGQALNCFKPWDARLDTSKFLQSDADEELIIYIPFTGSVKLKSIMIIGGAKGESPKKLSV